jgi:hypothetical protein
MRDAIDEHRARRRSQVKRVLCACTYHTRHVTRDVCRPLHVTPEQMVRLTVDEASRCLCALAAVSVRRQIS